MTIRPVASLDDRYTTVKGRVFLSGIQALVRLPLVQRARDRAQGLDTAGFITGYRGSPLGGYDAALWQAKSHLQANDILFQPAVNEELAATALIGSQQVNLYADAAHEGVFAIWYGKGPGADRAGDAMKHANSLGSSAKGGALVVIGDDPGAVSSSLAHQCEQLLMSWMMPLLFPASIHEYVDFGLLGIAMSRYSGCYTGFKAVSEVVETAASVEVDPDLPHIVMPQDFDRPPEGLGIRWPYPQLEQEERLQTQRLPAAKAFARANRIDRMVIGGGHGGGGHDGGGARIGIAAAGKAFQDLMQALDDLGIDARAAERMGLRVYKIGMVWPLEPEGAKTFVRGLEQVIVIEEKRAFIETQLKELLYNLPATERPRIIGKTDENGAPLLPTTGELSPDIIARLLARRLPRPADDGRWTAHLDFLERKAAEAKRPPPAVRPPIFCSGCPHNISTRLPEGSRALVGTGCHLIAAFLDRNTDIFIQMGGEGAHWVGQAPFCKTDHIFQNLGDGTYVHSGYMALRQAVATGTSITFKILFNDAVAMTGGQPSEGGFTVPQITRQVHAEGVRRIAVVTQEDGKYPIASDFAPGVTFHQRGEMDGLQRDLRNWPGVSVLIYDQVCATEKRRRRRRGQYPAVQKRVFINQAVCEDCGDCVVQSSCVSVVSVATPLGRKRAIDQSACNEDLSCLDGFCPSMVTIEGAELRVKDLTGEDPAAGLEAPPTPPLAKPYGILIAGIGGEGVITVGQILGMAAHLDGLGCATLDFTGLAQKGGGVLTHVRLATDPLAVHVPRLPTGGADLLIAGDMVVAAGPESLSKLRHGTSRAVVNDHLMPVAGNLLDPASSLDGAALRQTITEAVGSPATTFLNATRIAEALSGNRVGANIFLLGHAFQKGWLPLSLQALLQAIRLNGVAMEANRFLFAWGRRAAHDPASIHAAVPDLAPPPDPREESPDVLIERHVAYLTAYQNAALGERYRRLVETTRRREGERAPGHDGLARAVALGYFKLLSYKDEYEVARLFSDGAFAAELAERFAPGRRLTFHMAPPFLAAHTDSQGRPRKRAFGPWMLPAMGLLARFKGLRGTWLDPFGWTVERRMERRMIGQYEVIVAELLNGLSAENHALAQRIAALAQEVRGFGPIKMAAMEKTEEKIDHLMRQFGDRGPHKLDAE